jgi:hypothetical protein
VKTRVRSARQTGEIVKTPDSALVRDVPEPAKRLMVAQPDIRKYTKIFVIFAKFNGTIEKHFVKNY